jgi:hypothetical protein
LGLQLVVCLEALAEREAELHEADALVTHYEANLSLLRQRCASL